jgi:TonB-linked SusC/RagA family outer membrane protein
MKKNYSLFFLLFVSSFLFAQTRTITGIVQSENSEPLIGATVLIEGTSQGTTTDFDGNFKLDVNANQTMLLITYTGYNDQKVDITGLNTVRVTLSEGVQLDEVVVVGYGIQKKVNLTGAVESIKGDQIARQPVMQASQALGGLSPGLTAIQSSGQPGSDGATLRIRGIGSIGASNNPLVLIDGVEGSINGVDPSNIENVSVLKDAAAAAIYGSRAANGVILITTKRAKAGETSVNYNTWFGVQSVTDQPKYLGVIDYLTYSGADQAFIDNYQANLNNPDEYPDTDWIEELFTENGFQQYHNVSVNAGTDNAKVLASFSYMDQGSNIANYNFKRYTGQINSDLKISDAFGINFDINFRQSKRDNPNTGLGNVTNQAYRIPPDQIAIHTDGRWGDGWQGQNPIAAVHDGGQNLSEFNYFRGRLKANYTPFEGLTLSAMYAPEYNDSYYKNFNKQYQTVIDWVGGSTRTVPNRNSLSQSNTRQFTHNFNATANYLKTIGEKHDFSFLLGYEVIKFTSDNFGASRTDFLLDNIQVLNAGSEENDNNGGSATHNGLLSWFGRVNYNFGSKYLFEANLRRDASSRFSRDNRVAYFPSFSAGWVISRESFFNEDGAVSGLKLRASWGQLGNQSIGSDFPYASTISLGSTNYLFGNSIATGAAQTVLSNRAIQWETTTTTNIGLDISFLKDRLSFTADYYLRKTDDILLGLPIPLVVGLSPSTQNAGSVENKGWDLAANWRETRGAVRYSIRANIADVKNEVTDLAGVGPIISGNSIIEVGGSLGSIYGYETQSIFQSEEEVNGAPVQFGSYTAGDIRYVDQNGDNKINAEDRAIIGNSFPTLNYGLEFNIGYKGLDFSMAWQGVGKRDVLLQGDAAWALYNAGKIQEWHVTDSWSPSNTSAAFPRISPTSSGSNNARASSTWIFDASYLRLRNVTLSYTLPNVLLENIFIDNARIYLTGQNVLTIDNLPPGLDPLVPNGTSGAFFPIVSSYNFGVDLRF